MITLDLQVSSPAPHGVGIDLTHVPASVLLLHVSNVQLPLFVLPVGERHPLVPGDDAVVDGQDGLGVHPHPGNLENKNIVFMVRNLIWDFSFIKVAVNFD